MIGKTITDRASGTPAIHEYGRLISDLMMYFGSILYKQHGPRSEGGGRAGVRTPPPP